MHKTGLPPCSRIDRQSHFPIDPLTYKQHVHFHLFLGGMATGPFVPWLSKISLWTAGVSGYLGSASLTSTDLNVEAVAENSVPESFERCVFQVQPVGHGDGMSHGIKGGQVFIQASRTSLTQTLPFASFARPHLCGKSTKFGECAYVAAEKHFSKCMCICVASQYTFGDFVSAIGERLPWGT